MIKFKKQSLEYAKVMNTWINEDIKKYALFDNDFIGEYNYYKENSDGENKAHLFAVFNDKEMIGYLAIITWSDCGVYGHTINPIIINPKYQNQGFGVKVINELIEKLNHDKESIAEVIEAVVDKENKKAIKLFKHLGFERINREDNFIQFNFYL